jgi:hypothetical protein
MRYTGKSLPQLIKIAQNWHNKVVRKRDENERCISCGNSKVTDAGHYIAVGACSGLRFDLDNTHGQCGSCNRFKGGNQINYRFGLQDRIGRKRLNKLELKYRMFKRSPHKWDRFSVIEVIKDRQKQYKSLSKSFIL